MSDSDPKRTLRELKDYLADSYEAAGRLAERVGISNVTLRDVLSGHRKPSATTIAKMRLFLDAEAIQIQALFVLSVGIWSLPRTEKRVGKVRSLASTR